MSKRAALYARISITDKKVPKVANQLANLRKLAADRGYQVVGEYSDDGISASTGEARPDWERLLTDLDAGQFDIILATEEARLTRNNHDKTSLTLACTAARVTWETVRDGAVDPATAAGEFLSVIRGAVDTLESKRKAERQRDANATRRANGLHAIGGPRPFGWAGDRVTISKREAKLVRRGTAQILAGHSLHQVVQEWRASGINPPRAGAWTRMSVLMVLTRWRNAAVVSHHDEPLGEGQWDAIVDRASVEGVRAILLNGGGERRKAKHLCSGIAHCSCGQIMIANGSNKESAYMCSARIRGRALPGVAHASVMQKLLDPMVRDAVIDSYLMKPTSGSASQAEAATLATLWARREEAQRTISQIQDDREAGVYTAAEAAQRIVKWRKVAEEANAEITTLAAASAHAAMLVEARVSLIADAPEGSLHGAYARMLQEDNDLSREEAVDHVLRWRWSFKANAEEVQEMRDALGKRFDDMPLDQQRHLVRSLVSIDVAPGRGTDRVAVEPLSALGTR
jgi:DNA invertase Pin-like site-specific DNA recombinase